jgi:hypothetical protein
MLSSSIDSEPRLSVCWSAVVLPSSGRPQLCTLRDLSPTTATLARTSGLEPDQMMMLRIRYPNGWFTMAARVAWVEDERAGVTFAGGAPQMLDRLRDAMLVLVQRTRRVPGRILVAGLEGDEAEDVDQCAHSHRLASVHTSSFDKAVQSLETRGAPTVAIVSATLDGATELLSVVARRRPRATRILVCQRAGGPTSPERGVRVLWSPWEVGDLDDLLTSAMG